MGRFHRIFSNFHGGDWVQCLKLQIFIETFPKVRKILQFRCFHFPLLFIPSPTISRGFSDPKHAYQLIQNPGFLTLSILTGMTVFLLSCRPEPPTCSARGAPCLSTLAARMLVSSTSSSDDDDDLLPFRCECISRSRLTQSVTNPATLYDARQYQHQQGADKRFCHIRI